MKKINLSLVTFIVFLILKLTGNITWSWLWVTSPLWIPALLAISFLFLFILLIIFYFMLGGEATIINEVLEGKKEEGK